MRRIQQWQRPLGHHHAAAAAPKVRCSSMAAARFCTQQQPNGRRPGPQTSTTAAAERRLGSPQAWAAGVRSFTTSPARRRQAADSVETPTPTSAPAPAADAVAATEGAENFNDEALALSEEPEEAVAAATPPSLVVPGPYDVAPRPSDIADASYEPVISGEGLEVVGGLDGWWERDDHWDPAVVYRGFGPAARVTDAAVLTVLLRRAVLEALAVREASKKGAEAEGGAAATATPRLVDAWKRGGRAELDAALQLGLDVAADGSVAALHGDTAAVAAGLAVAGQAGLEADSATAAAEEAAVEATEDYVPSADEARELVGSWDLAWESLSLGDAALKFAITKRVYQLTGHLLSDSLLASASTVGALRALLVKPPKARKLAEDLLSDGTLTSLPNVAVYSRRVTPIDRHKMVGRWKVITEELEKRELPITGKGKHDKSVEKKWMFG